MNTLKWWLMGIGLVIVVFGIGFWLGIRFEKLEFLRIVDGDTFWVTNLRDGSEWKVRLWGVDAPDSKQCYFEEATEMLKNDLVGKRLRFERFGRDDYGRILARVYADGVSVEEALVATGAAAAYGAKDVHALLKPSKEYVDSLKKIEEKARSERLGMWSEKCDK